MDKTEYRMKLDEINNLVEAQDYEGALELVDAIEWRRVKSVRTLCMVADIYEMNGELEKSMKLLQLAYKRSSVGKMILYRQVELALKMNRYDDAVHYYNQYLETAANDTSKYILKYKIYKAQNAPLEEQIAILEEYKEREYTERWVYELAKLYKKAGKQDKCIAVCDDLILWFGEGKYVTKAMELKMTYVPLTPEQKLRYDQREQAGESETGSNTGRNTRPYTSVTASTVSHISDAARMSLQNASIIPSESEQTGAMREAAAAVDRGSSRSDGIPTHVDTTQLQAKLARSFQEVLAGFNRTKIHASADSAGRAAADSRSEAPLRDESMEAYQVSRLEPETANETKISAEKGSAIAHRVEMPEAYEPAPESMEKPEDHEVISVKDMDLDALFAETSNEFAAAAESGRVGVELSPEEEAAESGSGKEKVSSEKVSSEKASSGRQTSAREVFRGQVSEDTVSGTVVSEEADSKTAGEEEKAEPFALSKEAEAAMAAFEASLYMDDFSGSGSAASSVNAEENSEEAAGDESGEDADAALQSQVPDEASRELERMASAIEASSESAAQQEDADASAELEELAAVIGGSQTFLEQTQEVQEPAEAGEKSSQPETEPSECEQSNVEPFTVETSEDGAEKTAESDALESMDAASEAAEAKLIAEAGEEAKTQEAELKEAEGAGTESQNIEIQETKTQGTETEATETETTGTTETGETETTETEATEKGTTGATATETEEIETEEIETEEIETEEIETETTGTTETEATKKGTTGATETEATEIETEATENIEVESKETEFAEAEIRKTEAEIQEAEAEIKKTEAEIEEAMQEASAADIAAAEENQSGNGSQGSGGNLEEQLLAALGGQPEAESGSEKQLLDQVQSVMGDPDDESAENSDFIPDLDLGIVLELHKEKEEPEPAVSASSEQKGLSEVDQMLAEAEAEPEATPAALIRETPEEKRYRILNATRPEKLTDEQRRLFSYFAKIPGMDEQILKAIEGVYRHADEKTSHRGNIAIMGSHGTGKTRLTEGLVKAICKELGLQAVKYACVKAADMNRKDPAVVIAKMAGGFLLIERASDMTAETIDMLSKSMDFRTDGMILIIEDDKVNMRKLLSDHPDFAKKFHTVISIPVFTNDELVSFARTYAKENGYRMDEMGVLALYTMIGDNQREDEPITIGRVKEMVDGAIRRAGNARLGRRISGRRTDEEGRILLYEKDFDM